LEVPAVDTLVGSFFDALIELFVNSLEGSFGDDMLVSLSVDDFCKTISVESLTDGLIEFFSIVLEVSRFDDPLEETLIGTSLSKVNTTGLGCFGVKLPKTVSI
jgi:hypothetical protein